MKKPASVFAAALASALLFGGAAAAQSERLSADEILNRLTRQAETEQARGGGAAGGATRGISVSDGRSEATGAPANVAASRPDPATPTPAAAGPQVVPASDRVDLRITFETNSAFIRPGAAQQLGELCDALNRAPENWVFNIVGHADAAGDPNYNRRLSEARAREVARYLERECSLKPDRLAVFGLGSSRLLDGVPPVSEANRRVEVSINRI